MTSHTDPPPLDRVALEAAGDAGDIDPELLGNFVPEVAAAVAAGTRLGRRELARYGDAGRKAAGAGVALRALVDLYLSAAWRMWRHLPEVINAAAEPAAVVLAGEVMLRAADDAVAILSEGYQLARRELVRAQAAARREFVDDLLVGGAQALAGLVERAGLFGLTLAGPHAVVVVRAEKPFTDSSPLTSILERSIQGSKADSDALVTTKDGSLVVIFAAPDRNAIDEVINGLTGSSADASRGRREAEPKRGRRPVADGCRPGPSRAGGRPTVVRGGPGSLRTGLPAGGFRTCAGRRRVARPSGAGT